MTALERFDDAADAAAARVISTYSTSFGLAVRLLGRRHRQHIRNVYAMVRVADEIVDGVATEAGLDRAAQRDALDRYIGDVHEALRTGYSPDLVVHAFARTARASGIGTDLTTPFFAAMATDAADDAHAAPTGSPRAYDTDAHAAYVYGSAEVVGLMCLRVFVRDEHPDAARLTILEAGARQLGAAFQNVNFLRDLADDTDRLGRSYLSETGRLDETGRDAWLATTRAELDDARRAIPLLPRDARAAVRAALSLFDAVARRVERTPVETLYRERVRVPDTVKAGLAARACLQTWTERAA